MINTFSSTVRVYVITKMNELNIKNTNPIVQLNSLNKLNEFLKNSIVP